MQSLSDSKTSARFVNSTKCMPSRVVYTSDNLPIAFAMADAADSAFSANLSADLACQTVRFPAREISFVARGEDRALTIPALKSGVGAGESLRREIVTRGGGLRLGPCGQRGRRDRCQTERRRRQRCRTRGRVTRRSLGAGSSEQPQEDWP